LKIDTDSLFINIGGFLNTNLGDSWRKLPEERLLSYIKSIANVLSEYVNDHCYREMQREFYNSANTEFRIVFKQEVIAKTALFVKKKKYSMWIVDEEGASTNKIKTTGLEIVRSDTPEVVRPMLKTIMEMILKNRTDDEILQIIDECKKKLHGVYPEEIASNIGVSNLEKYITADGNAKKGTPSHVKAAINYKKLLDILHIEDKYEEIQSGTKMKKVYLMKNQYGFDAMAFLRWPSEFDSIIQINYDKMIEKTFVSKINILLDPMNKTELLNMCKENLGLFFV